MKVHTILGVAVLLCSSGVRASCPAPWMENLKGLWQASYQASSDQEVANVFNISLCDPLPTSAGCEDAAVCMRSRGSADVTRVGKFESGSEVNTTANSSSNWEYRVNYKSSCEANPMMEGTVTLEFWCGTTLGAPEVVFSDSVKCRHTIIWKTWAACHQNTISRFQAFNEKPCYILDRKGGLIDLSRLVHTNGATMVTLGETRYFFDMCRRIHRDPKSTHIPTVCDKQALCSAPELSPMNGTALAVNSSRLHFDSANDALYIQFKGSSSDSCPNGFEASLRLSCPSHLGRERGISMVSDGNCNLEFSWITQHACPRKTHISESCVLTQDGHTYDIRPLVPATKSGYIEASGSPENVVFKLNPCTPFVGIEGCQGVTACQVDHGHAHAMGQVFDRQFHLVDGEFALTLEHGAKCSSHLHRITVIEYQCNTTVGYGRPKFLREDNCVYIFEWPNNVTCVGASDSKANNDNLVKESPHSKNPETEVRDEEPPPLCQTSQEVNGKALHYNLSPLMKDDGNWQVVTGKGERAYTYFINVCQALVRKGRAANCSSSASSCQVRSDGKPPAFSAGNFVSAPKFEAGAITLHYRHGSKCHHAGERETVIRFVCAPGVTTSSPVFEDELDDCTYTFQWRTAYACPDTAQSSEQCSITDSHSGYTFDMSNLGLRSSIVDGKNYTIAACGQSVKSVCKTDGGLCHFPEGNPEEAAVTVGSSSSLNLLSGDLSSTYTKEDKSCPNNKRQVIVQYTCPPRADTFQKETREDLPVDGTLHIDPVSLNDGNDCNLLAHWYTLKACVVSPEQCIVRDTKGQVQYDLSSLSIAKVNESNWKTDNSNGSVLFLINVCRPLMPVHGCHPHAAVCSVRPASNTTRPTDVRHYGAAVNSNIGLGVPSTTSLSVTFSGEVQLVYTSRPPKMAAMSTTAKDVCKTIINFHCKRDVPVGYPVFVEKIAGVCSYIFDWETAKACSLTEETKVSPEAGQPPDVSTKTPSLGTCRVSDESGYVFNMYGLHNHTDDYQLVDPQNSKVKLRLNVCDGLTKVCGDNKHAAACVTKEDGTQASVGAVNRTVRYFDGTLRLEYINGAACSSGDTSRKGKTVIEFTCQTTTHLSKPAITSSVDSCEFVVSWPTSLACPPRTVPCAVEVNGSLYDLSPLHLPRGYWDAIVPADSTYRYLINICGPVDDFKLNQSANCSNGMTAVCQVGKTPHSEKMAAFNAGHSQSSPVGIRDGLLELRLGNGDQCQHHHQSVRSTVIQFECDPYQTGVPEFQAETDCEYHFLWRTRYACAARHEKGENCIVADPYFPDHRYDLRPLQKLGSQKFTYTNSSTHSKYDFLLSVCSPLSTKKICANGNEKAGACQLQNGKALAAAGDSNGGLMYVNGNLELLYSHIPTSEEKRCHGKYVRSTRVIFKCDRSDDKGPVGSGPVMLSEMPDCQYVVEWYTPLACNPSFKEAPCTVADEHSGQVYNLASLSLNRGAWQASNKLSDRQYYLSMCGELNTGYAGPHKPCPFSTAVCAIMAKDNTSVSYGQVHTLSVEESSVVARYTDGSPCTDPLTKQSRHYETIVRFSCRRGSKGVPNLVQEDGCQAVFEWPSEAACGTRTIESKLPIVGPPSGGSKHSNQYSDASPVTEPPPPVLPDCVVESNVNHGVFDMRPLMGTVYKLKDANGMSYNLSVCGVLPKGSCPDAKTPHASVCQQTTRNGGNEWVNAGGDGGKLSYESGMVRLVIGNGTVCNHNKQPRKTVVQFYCDRVKTDSPHGTPVFDREEDCVYTIRWPTHLACEKELKCSITDKKSGEVFDLSSLSKFNDNWKATTSDSNTAESFLINVCRPLTPLASTKKCPFSSSSCMLLGDKYSSLGHINSGSLRQTSDGTVVLSYSGGEKTTTCPSGRSTNISFHCGDESPGPVLTSHSTCEYRFQWKTPLVCTKAELTKEEKKNTVVNAKKCIVTDGLSGSTFDLSTVYDGDRSYEVNGDRRYFINPCGDGVRRQDGCSNADVCAKSSTGAVSTSDMASRKISYDYMTNTINLTSTGGQCANGRKWKTTILFVCSRQRGVGNPMLLSENDCHLLLHWPTQKACSGIATECLMGVSNKALLDLTPLSRRHGSWHVKTPSGDKFWLNLCAPVHERIAGCSADAAVCWQPSNLHQAQSVGMSDIRRLHTTKDKKAAVIEYFSHQVCKENPKHTYQVKIVVSCNAKKPFSQPKLKSADDCLFSFDWESMAACPATARTGSQQQKYCGYRDRFHNSVDMSDILSHHKVVSTLEGQFHLQLCADENSRHCASGAAACMGPNTDNLETIAAKGYKYRRWTPTDGGVLLEVASDHRCDQDKARNHSIFVNFQCDSVQNVVFDHSTEHCQYVFEWKTPAVCLHLPTQQAMTTPHPGIDRQPGGEGGNTLRKSGDGSNPSEKKQGGSGARTFAIIVLVTTLLVLLVIGIVIYRSNDRLFMAHRIFCFCRGARSSAITRKTYKQLALSQEQRDLLNNDDEDENVLGGDDDEQLLAL